MRRPPPGEVTGWPPRFDFTGPERLQARNHDPVGRYIARLGLDKRRGGAPRIGEWERLTVTEIPPEKPTTTGRDPAVPSKPNFAGALLLASLLVIAWGFNLAATWTGTTDPVVPGWLFYGLMGGILFLLGVDISKVFRGRGDS